MRDLSGQTFGSYRLEDVIGRGGMGEVYRARHLRLTNRLAAVKVLPATLAIEADFLQRFEHEANSAASLDHPAILPVWDYGEQDGQPYLAMPFIPGGSLKEYLEQHGTLSPDEALHLIAAIAEALDYAHGRGIIHRDVKPANILLREDGRPLLADFGIAKAVEAGHSQGLTRSGMSIGTPEYMAPEQIEGKAEPRSDLYSLAVVLYQMLTGHVPYEGGTPYEIVYKQLNTPLPPLRWFRQDLSPTLEAVLSAALAKDPALRYPTGRAFVAAFREALGAAPNGVTVSNPVNSQATRRLDVAQATTPLVTQSPRSVAARPPAPPAPPLVVVPPPAHYRDEPRRTNGTPIGLIGALIAVIVVAIGLLGVYVAFFASPAPTPTPPVNTAATLAARTATANANAAAARTTATAAQATTLAAQATAQANQGAAAQATQNANATIAADQQAQQDATATANAAAQGAATATVSANATAAANTAATATGAVTQTIRANNAATATTVANATAAVVASATAAANANAAQTATVAARPTATAVPPTVTLTAAPPTQTPRPPTQTPAANWGPALTPLTGGKTYNDPQERFSFNTPNNWISRDPGTSEVAFNAPSGQASLAVNLSAASGGADLEALNKALEDEAKKQNGYSQISLDKILIDNHPAYRRIYKITQQGQQIQVAQYAFVNNDLAHVLTFACLPNDFKQFSPTFDNIAGTYKPNAR